MLLPKRRFSAHLMAARHNPSHDTIRRIFLAAPCVIIISKRHPYRRIYRVLRMSTGIVISSPLGYVTGGVQ
jgi:hypothetical protein